jgi:hypothetical protein
MSRSQQGFSHLASPMRRKLASNKKERKREREKRERGREVER